MIDVETFGSIYPSSELRLSGPIGTLVEQQKLISPTNLPLFENVWNRFGSNFIYSKY